MHRNDESALELLYERHGGRVFALAYRMLGLRGPAEEVVKRSFEAAWGDRRGGAAWSRGVRAWLLEIARGKAVDVLRGTASPGSPTRETAGFIRREPVGDGLAGGRTVSRDESAELLVLLAGLPAGQARVVDLAYFGGYDRDEIAEILGLSAHAVKARMRSALERLEGGSFRVTVVSDVHERCRSDVAALVLGALTQTETAALERHLRGCYACADYVERLRTVVEALAITVVPHPPRSGLKQEVLRRVR